MSSADQTLYEAICSDDKRRVEWATHQLTHKVKAVIRRHVLDNSGSEEDAADLTQETVLAVWAQLRSGHYQPRAEATLDAYVYKVMRNKWLKVLKRRKQVGLLSQFDDLTEEPTAEDKPERLATLQQAFSQLGEACQELLQLFYWDDLSFDEIAHRVNASAKAAKVRKYRCMLYLGALLRGEKRDGNE
ncbi:MULTISPECIES: RNA polymerase sigma factor [Spirosoma]|uniref:Sigma-70 family RNA polymerase sigma factor n=1 Tax=Spirosoma sordidisoli TaxID=2502893 RepID=A0A4Q2UHD7_9BACT|nr:MULTISPECIES: sigma-70 family RNA polymerase sigma factor [Spirosoma]RYC66875.1 sigma-70 family RNA polymerase sigma factor [Spirosoma sordidisoli]